MFSAFFVKVPQTRMDTGLVDITKNGHLAEFNNLLDPDRIAFITE
jgi:hypothetical protein